MKNFIKCIPYNIWPIIRAIYPPLKQYGKLPSIKWTKLALLKTHNINWNRKEFSHVLP